MEALKLIKTSDERVVAAALLDDPEASAQLVEIARKVLKKKEQQRKIPDLPEEEKAKKKSRSSDSMEVLFADILQETADDKIEKALKMVKSEKFHLPTGGSAHDNILYLAQWLRGYASTVGFVWAHITIEAERFIADILLHRLDTRSIATVVKKKDESYKALLAAWKTTGDEIGYSFDYVVSMLKVGCLLREFPRLQYYSAPTRLRDREAKLQEMFLTDAQHWSRCVPSLFDYTAASSPSTPTTPAASTTSPTTAAAADIEQMLIDGDSTGDD